MLTLDEALDAILETITPLGAEPCALDDALGRFVASSILAKEDAPPFDASAMDGGAVRAESEAETEAESEAEPEAEAESVPRFFLAVGESRAGGPLPPPLARGAAMRIFTGAVVPEGADAVVMQEHAEVRDGRVYLREPPIAGRFVRKRGEDLRAGAVLLEAGARIGSGELALIAGQGIASIPVHRVPRVAILTNGDELRDVGDPPRPGSVVDVNAIAIAAAVREAGAIPTVLPRGPDDLAILTERVRQGLRAAVLVVCGGVSVGDHDLVHHALRDAGVASRFWKVRMKPGKPLTFGLGNDGKTPVFGLPGNPVSAWVTFEVFVRPALRTLLGDRHPFRPAIDVVLSHPHRHDLGRPELARARLIRRDGAVPRAELLRRQGSGSLPSIAGVDALVILPAERETFEPGDVLEAIPLH